jgi:hypothetical protein
MGTSSLRYGLHVIHRYLPLTDTSSSILFRRFLRARLIKSARGLVGPRTAVTVPQSANRPRMTPSWANLSLAERMKHCRTRFRQQFEGQPYSEALEQFLRAFVGECRERHIPVFGVRFPLTDEYAGLVANNSFLPEGLVQELAIPVLDYRNIYVDRPAFFQDADHLNARGAEHFVPVLAAAIRRELAGGEDSSNPDN